MTDLDINATVPERHPIGTITTDLGGTFLCFLQDGYVFRILTASDAVYLDRPVDRHRPGEFLSNPEACVPEPVASIDDVTVDALPRITLRPWARLDHPLNRCVTDILWAPPIPTTNSEGRADD